MHLWKKPYYYILPNNAVEKDDLFYNVNCIPTHHKIIYNIISIFTCYKTNNIRQILVNFIIAFFFFLLCVKYASFHKHNI